MAEASMGHGTAWLTWFSPSAGRTTSLYRLSALLTTPTTSPLPRSHRRKRRASGNTV